MNKIYDKNITDPENGNKVKNIWLKKKSKTGKNITILIWNKYRDRKKTSVKNIYNKYDHENLIVRYSLYSEKKS